VNIKTIIRNAEDLSIPENKEFVMKVFDANGKEILNEKFKTNEY
jgi:hypothetical protein